MQGGGSIVDSAAIELNLASIRHTGTLIERRESRFTGRDHGRRMATILGGCPGSPHAESRRQKRRRMRAATGTLSQDGSHALLRTYFGGTPTPLRAVELPSDGGEASESRTFTKQFRQ